MSGLGHIYFSFPLATLGADLFGRPGDLIDATINPFNDIQFGVELLGEPTADLGTFLGDTYAKVVDGCPDGPGQEQFSSQPYFFPDVKPGDQPRQWPPKGYFDFGEDGRWPP